jgi:peptidoglycan hydrolase-like protein with peptidoglycan-binding domain
LKTRSLPLLLSTFAFALLLAVAASAATKRGPLSRAEIREGEHRLAGLGYWTGPVDGVWDEGSRHALIAFQKTQGLRRTGVLTRDLLSALARATPPVPRQPQGFHIEVDLGRQILFVVDDEGRVGNVLPVSSGSGKRFKEAGYPATEAVTPCGHLEVFSKFKGHRTSPLGEMDNPLYIVGGIAIHGSVSVPTYPASHGCIRIPMFASKRLFDFIPMMTPVLVYGCPGEVPPPLVPAPVPTIAPPPVTPPP